MVHIRCLFLYSLYTSSHHNLQLMPTAFPRLEYQMLRSDLGPVESARKFLDTVTRCNMIFIITTLHSFKGAIITAVLASVSSLPCVMFDFGRGIDFFAFVFVCFYPGKKKTIQIFLTFSNWAHYAKRGFN